MTLHHPGLLAAFSLAFTLALAGSGSAQNAPLALPSPAEAPATSGKTAPSRTAKKPSQHRKKPAEAADNGLALSGKARSGKGAEPTFSEPAKSKKFVPAEFDNGDDSNGAAKPFVTPSGRAGVGMRF